jgi:HSP20 family protein
VERKRKDMDHLQGEIEELFADLWQVPRFSGLRSAFRPQVDCYRTSDPPALVVLFELPGVDPEAVQLVIADGTLMVAGKRPRPASEDLVYQQMELEYGPFLRRIPLPEEVDVEAATASYDRGMLKVVLPLAQHRTEREHVVIAVIRS